ncbi:MAG: alpha,alpha-trehalase TreF [Bacteroidota bacterium]
MTNPVSKVRLIMATISLIIFTACQQTSEKVSTEYYQSDFFKAAQMAGMFPDSKTFVDCTAKRPITEIQELYAKAKEQQGFDMKSFVEEHFEMPVTPDTGFKTDTTKTMKHHLVDLWPVLTRQPDQYNEQSSLLPLPKRYIVPGGRFREIYYWDSYFTLTGLMVSGQEEMATNMVDNFSFLIDSMGFIPNGNRNYYKGRSQPPFYSLMVNLIAEDDRDKFVGYLPQMLKEYNFWMTGAEELSETSNAFKRVVKLDDGTILNRYWDNYALPRPESYKEDFELAEELGGDAETVYRHLRAGAESGWDFSSRWFKDGQNLSTIHTTEIIPVDLNSLIYHLELKIAQAYNWKEELDSAKLFLEKADSRKKAINEYLWDEEDQFYIDYDFVAGRKTGVLSLAAAYPLFFNIGDKSQAKSVAERLEAEFLKGGGFVSTLNDTGEQWDYPNGWAPLQWMTVNGLYNYGFDELGNDAAKRWLDRNEQVYKSTGKMMEKYDVINTELLAGGGEYPLQDGFGWTNGVALAFMKIFEEGAVVEEMREAD